MHDLRYIESWNQMQPLSLREFDIVVNKVIYDDILNTISQDELRRQIVLRLPGYSDSDVFRFRVDFADSATTFINRLFDKHVDDDTVIVASMNEHESVLKCLAKFRNKILLSNLEIQNLDFRNIDPKILARKKVFAYFASIQITPGFYVPDIFFFKLKSVLKSLSCEVTFILDDVQGMFFYPRRYDDFDYVIGTAHALIRDFDMGILFSRSEDDEEIKNVNFKAYLSKLDIILSRKTKMFMFNFILRQQFINLFLQYPKWIKLHEQRLHGVESVPNYFSILTDIPKSDSLFDALKKYEIFLEADDHDLSFPVLRIRALQYLAYPRMLIDGVRYLENLLEYY